MRQIPETLPRVRAFILLRYTLIIATAYLLLVENEFSSLPSGVIVLIVVALTSNVLMTWLPERITDSTAFNATVIIGDTVWITAALLYSGLFRSDFFYVYFFLLLLAAIGENLFLIGVGAIVACTGYLYILANTTTSLQLWSSSSLIRIPFLITAAAFYGYLVDQVRRERQRAHAESNTAAQLEREISEGKRAKDAMRAAKDYAENLINSSLDMMISADVNRNIVEFNHAAEHAFGYSKAEVTGRPIDLLYTDPSESSMLNTTLLKYGSFTGEVTNKRKNGEIFCSYLSASVMRDTDGRVVGVMGISRDITERKRAEESLQESEQRFRKIFEEGPLGMAIIDRDYRFVKVNSALCRMVGYSPEEFTALTFLEITHPEDVENDLQLSEKLFRDEIPYFTIEKRYITKSHEILWISLTATVIRDEEGHPLYGLAMIEDVSERKRADVTRDALYRASLAIQEPLALKERINHLISIARTVLDLDRVNIFLADPEGQWLQAVASVGTTETLEAIRVPIGPSGGSIAQAYLTRHPFVWSGRGGPLPAEMRLKPPYDKIEALRSRAFVNLPLLAEGRAIGVLGADRKNSRRPLESDTVELLQLFATQAAIAIENARLFEEMESTARHQLALNQVAQTVNQSLNLQETLEAALDATLKAVEVEAGNIRLWDEHEGVLAIAASRGMSEGYITKRRYFKRREGVSGNAFERGETFLVEDMAEYAHLNEMVQREGVRSVASIPIRSRDKKVGVMSILSHGQRRFSPMEIKLLTAIGNQIGTVIENARLFEQIAQGKREWETTFDAIADGIVLLDERGTVARANYAFGSWWDSPPESLVGTAWHTLWDRLGVRAPCPHCQVLDCKTPVVADADLPGSARFMTLTAFPLQPKDPMPSAPVAGTILILRDITERKQAEEELKATQLQLIQSEKFESVGRLAAGIAHEVKNPLAIIQQGVTYIRDTVSKTNGATVTLVLEKMDNAVRRADRVIKGLLDFSVPKAVDMTPVDLNAVVEESLLLVKHELVKAHVTPVKELRENLPPLKLDQHKIEQVFVNLFMNAIQAMPDGGTLTVKTDVQQRTESGPNAARRKSDRFSIAETVVAVYVEDTGTGIPDDKLNRAFDPFFTTKAPGQGTGLGLTVARKIIELHGATIDIGNRKEGGVRATLMFRTEEDHGDAKDTKSQNQEMQKI